MKGFSIYPYMYYRLATWYFRFEKKGKISYGASILVSLSQVIILTDILGFYIGGIPYLGTIIMAISQGYEPSPPMLSAYKDWWRIFSVKKPATKRKYLAKSIAEIGGLPYVQPARTLTALENTFGKMNKGESINIIDWQLFLWSKYMLGLKEEKGKSAFKGIKAIQPLNKGGGL